MQQYTIGPQQAYERVTKVNPIHAENTSMYIVLDPSPKLGILVDNFQEEALLLDSIAMLPH